MRTRFVNLTVVFVFLLLWTGIFNLAVIQGRKYKELSNRNSIRLLPQMGSRGRILDRHTKTIVDSYLTYDVMILPRDNNYSDKVLENLSGILEVSLKEIKNKLKHGSPAPLVPVTLARNIEMKKAMLLEELKWDVPGIVIHPRPLRSYPHAQIAAHVLGYVNEIDRWRLKKLADYGYQTKDLVGFGGVEEKYDYYLRQEEGGLSMEIDHRGRFIRTLGFKSPRNGRNIQLTLDLKIQKIAEEAIRDRKGCVIVMHPYTGEIIAMVNRPSFNPSVFVKTLDYPFNYLFNDPSAPLINRAISGLYSAGSVFKLVVATAALETGMLDSSTTFFCPGKINIGEQEFSCWNTHHQMNLLSAIIHSCNIFFYRTGLLVGAQTIYDYALKFGFSRTTGVDLFYEAEGFIPSPLWKRIRRFKTWFAGDTANLAIGQGELLITPLQLTRMMAVFANQGMLVTPYILKAVDGCDVSVSQRRMLRINIRKSTIDYIRQGLRKVVSEPDGTAYVLAGLSVAVAGKTGTAQVNRGEPHGWFVGFFPFHRPEFVICVFLENGGSGYAASVLAKKIIEEILNAD